MAAGAWPEKENPNTTRINEIIDYVKQVTPFRTGADRGPILTLIFRFHQIKRF